MKELMMLVGAYVLMLIVSVGTALGLHFSNADPLVSVIGGSAAGVFLYVGICAMKPEFLGEVPEGLDEPNERSNKRLKEKPHKS